MCVYAHQKRSTKQEKEREEVFTSDNKIKFSFLLFHHKNNFSFHKSQRSEISRHLNAATINSKLKRLKHKPRDRL